MCGRAALRASPEELRDVFGLDDTPELVPHYNVPPSQPLAVVRVLGAGGRKMESLRWGLVPAWAEDVKIGNRLSLARVETVATLPAFREALRKRRCLVAVDGFYEWKRAGKEKSQPFFLGRPDGAPFALAGLWERWVSRDGDVVESCAIVTRAALPPADAVHDRMPLVLDKAAWEAWMDPAREDVSALLGQPAPELVAHPVSDYVNDPRHDDARCVERSEPAQQSLFESLVR